MESDTFEHWKSQCLSKCDFSKKGSVDEDISHVVSFINSHDRYFTTSSCSGRIILFDGYKYINVVTSKYKEQNDSKYFKQDQMSASWVSDCPDVQKQNCSWLFVTHQKCQREDVVTGLEKSIGDATFKFEPFVLHVQCKQLGDAQLLHTVSINSGFRNSGITVGKKGKIIMAVRSTHCLEVPLSHKGNVLATHQYLDFLVGVANQKMEENLKRIERFYECLQGVLQPQEQKCSLKEEADKKPIYRRRRKRTQGDSMKLSENENSEEEIDCNLLFSSNLFDMLPEQLETSFPELEGRCCPAVYKSTVLFISNKQSVRRRCKNAVWFGAHFLWIRRHYGRSLVLQRLI